MQDIHSKILIVDDDRRLRELLLRYLSEQGFAVTVVADGIALDKMLLRESFDLLVLDLMLPGEDGLSICRRLRGNSPHPPILMLTAKGDEIDRIVGLELGADDYLPKPFNPRELVARIKAILRRQNKPLPGSPGDKILHFGKFHLDQSLRSLQIDGRDIALTSGEFALLSVMAAHPRQPLSRDKLMRLTKGRDADALDRSIDVQISRLRRLIEPDPAHPRYIQTVWGFGYVFVPDEGVPS